MLERLNYYWRLFGTGLSFFLFGCMGILVWGLMFPLIAPFLGRGEIKKRRTRELMSGIFRVYMDFMRLIGILDYRVLGRREQLAEGGNLVIANHPCLLDIVFLISQIPNATCIVKPALIRNPFMRIPIRAAGYVYAEDPELLIRHCAEELKGGGSLIIFPEGTRTKPGNAVKFQRGAAAIALHAEANLLPVTIYCTPSTLTKHEKWYQIPQKRFTLSLYVGDHMRLTPVSEKIGRPQLTRQLTRQLEAYFIEQLAQHGKY